MTEIKTFCIMCKKDIPQDRAIRKSNTCSRECSTELKRVRRAYVDERKCRHCHRPSTVEDRKAFIAWRRSAPEFKPVKKGRPRNKPETHDADCPCFGDVVEHGAECKNCECEREQK